MQDELLNEALFFRLEHARAKWRSATRHRRPVPSNSPQQAITRRSLVAQRANLLLTPPRGHNYARTPIPAGDTSMAAQKRDYRLAALSPTADDSIRHDHSYANLSIVPYSIC